MKMLIFRGFSMDTAPNVKQLFLSLLAANHSVNLLRNGNRTLVAGMDTILFKPFGMICGKSMDINEGIFTLLRDFPGDLRDLTDDQGLDVMICGSFCLTFREKGGRQGTQNDQVSP